MAGNRVQVMHKIRVPLPTGILFLFYGIRTVLILHFIFVLQTINMVFERAKTLKSKLLKQYSKEYAGYLAYQVSV